MKGGRCQNVKVIKVILSKGFFFLLIYSVKTLPFALRYSYQLNVFPSPLFSNQEHLSVSHNSLTTLHGELSSLPNLRVKIVIISIVLFLIYRMNRVLAPVMIWICQWCFNSIFRQLWPGQTTSRTLEFQMTFLIWMISQYWYVSFYCIELKNFIEYVEFLMCSLKRNCLLTTEINKAHYTMSYFSIVLHLS